MIVVPVVILILLCALILGAANFLFDFALNPKGKFTMTDLFKNGSVAGMDHVGKEYDLAPEVRAWWDYSADAEAWFHEQGRSVTITSHDGLKLHSWHFSQGGHRYIIACHGYVGYPAQMAGYARKFHDLGFTVLTPAAQGHEKSEGKYYGMGWLERKHMLDWINYILEGDPAAKIVLYGVSMGGATVMMAAGEDLPENVKCIIEDCGYSDVWTEFKVQLKNLFKLPSFPLLPAANAICRLRTGYSFEDASAVEQLKKAKVPMLFIHGEKDVFVPFDMLDTVYEACASSEKEKLPIPKAPHAASAYTDPVLYWQTVENFLGRYFE